MPPRPDGLPPRALSWLGFVGSASSPVGGRASPILSAHRLSAPGSIASRWIPRVWCALGKNSDAPLQAHGRQMLTWGNDPLGLTHPGGGLVCAPLTEHRR